MNAELRAFWSDEVEDLDHFSPPQPDCFKLRLVASIGIHGQPGQDTYELLLCTPKFLENELTINQVLPAIHRLIVKEYNIDQVEGWLRTYCLSIAGDSVNEIQDRLRLLGHWEFEDYRESPHKELRRTDQSKN